MALAGSPPRGRDAAGGRRAVVVVAALGHELRVAHPRELLVEDAVPVAAHDALEQLGGRHARRAARGEELACVWSWG